jgi:ketosteroid isomerase-like protein
MMRSTPRRSASDMRNALSILALLLCSLLFSPNARAQAVLQPPPRLDPQGTPAKEPAAQDSVPRAGTSSDQDNPLHTASRAELDVVKVIVGQEKAWNAGDIEGFVNNYKDSPETIFIGKQVDKGYKAIVEDYRHDYITRASMGNLTYSELEVTPLSESFAICTGRYHLDRGKRDGGPADGLFSLVLEKTARGWKIVLDHTT